MRTLVVLLATLLLVPALGAAPPATAAAAPLVDAGATTRAFAGADFMLDGHAEGFGGAVAATWTAPAACVVADPSALVTTASCAEAGIHAFGLHATDGAASASDSVLHVIVAEVASELLAVQGTILAGAGGVCCGALPRGGWQPGPNAGPYPFTVAEGTQRLELALAWRGETPGLADNLDIFVYGPGGFTTRAGTGAHPERLVLDAPAPGDWEAWVSSSLVAERVEWSLWANGTAVVGPELPDFRVPGAAPDRDGNVRLFANLTDGRPAVFRWELDAGSRRFDDRLGHNVSAPFAGPALVRVRVTTEEGFELDRLVPVRERGALARPLTVVAIIDSSFSPYHNDFLGAHHPWNLDADASNDIDFMEHPAAYVADIIDVTPLQIVLPAGNATNVDVTRTTQDGGLWASMDRSTTSAPRAYWFPGTKVVAALKFGATFQANNAAHGTVSAAVAAGNIHGTCPECVFVLVQGSGDAALNWVARQPWIDIVSNSYGAGSVVQANTPQGLTRDNAYWKLPLAPTRDASEDGLVVVFSAGNGFVNAFDVPMFTYWSSQKGPDWMVTVGAVDPREKQTYSGAGKPVDISSIGSGYPAPGGTNASGVGTHSGTSNAAPVVAGYFAKALQKARETLGDVTPGHADGVVASGPAVACGDALASCALADGVLTRRELEDGVYASVLPSATGVAATTTWPSTPLNYYYQGHGVLRGRIDGAATYEAEWTRIVDHLHGVVPAYDRPAGETTWFKVDSKCRQLLWGRWTGGLWTGETIAFDPTVDAVAMSFDAWCSNVPERPFETLVATGHVP